MAETQDLVLLHGALGASSQLYPLAVALRSRFRIHQLDFEGHGNAPPRGRRFRIQHFAENVLELLDSAGVAQAKFFGYSMGGYVALSLALEHPDRVDKVATLGTKFRWHPDIAAREAARLDPAIIAEKLPEFAKALTDRHVEAGGWEKVLASTAEFLRHLGESPVLTDETLAFIHQPVRVIVGTRDNTVDVEESLSVSRGMPAGSLTELPDAPHPIEQVDLEALVPVLFDFFSEPPPTEPDV